MTARGERILKPLLQVGDTFESWEDMKKIVVDEGIRTERNLVSHKKDLYRWRLRCKMNDVKYGQNSCPWYVRATLKSRTESVTITHANFTHTCEIADHYKRRMHSNSSRLADRIMDIVVKNRQTRPSSLRDTVQAWVHPDIEYHTAYAAKKICLKRLDGDQTESFKFIPAHCHHILERDPRAMAKYRAPDKHLDFLFVCPSASQDAFRHCRPMVALDGTHTRCMYPGILLIATCLDANNTVVVLAYAWVPTENKENWLMFLNCLGDAMPDLSKPGTVFLSDREKGLTEGVPHVFPRGNPAYCTWHLGENVHKHFGKEIRKLFDQLPYAVTAEKFNDKVKHISEKNKKAGVYIKNTADPKFYSRSAFPSRRWGHMTSQQAESSNKAFKPQRQEVTLNMSSQIWDWIMVKFFEKAELANRIGTPFPPKIMQALAEVEEKAAHLIAHPSSPCEVRITDSENRQYLVQIEPEWYCTCGDFQDELLPCTHAWRALTKLSLRHFDYVSPYYSTDTFKKTYDTHLPALLRDGLLPDQNCGEPLKKRRKGRPTERVRMGFEDDEVCRLPRKCGFCGERGHDRRNCPERLKELTAEFSENEEDGVHSDSTEQAENIMPAPPINPGGGSANEIPDMDNLYAEELDGTATTTISTFGTQESISISSFSQLMSEMDMSQPSTSTRIN